jgi:biopolymer transport protein ExbD
MGISASSESPSSVRNDINVTPLIDVLLVLLIIFLVIIPIMMKRETLDVPPKLLPDSTVEDAIVVVIKVRNDASMTYCDGTAEPSAIQSNELAAKLRPKIEAQKNGKVVFVDFEEGVPWRSVVTTMDAIRALASDSSHDEVKIALRVKDDEPGQTSKSPCDN